MRGEGTKMEESKIVYIDYLRMVWNKKWLIIIGTFSCMFVAGLASFLLPSIYETDAIIQTGRFFVQNTAGNFDQVIVEKPQQIVEKVNHGSFDTIIASQINISVKQMPKIEASYFRDTLLTRVWIRNHNVELAKEILDLLITFLKKDIDRKIEIEINNLETTIETQGIEKDRRNNEIESINKTIKIVDQRQSDILQEMESTKSRISELEQEQIKILKKKNRSEMESLGLLLYSNEIQQSLIYSNTLNEKLSEKKIEKETLQFQIQLQTAEIEKIDSEIGKLTMMKGRIDHTQVVKAPTRSGNPVFPRIRLNLLIAGILGFVLFTMLALFIFSMERHEVKI